MSETPSTAVALGGLLARIRQRLDLSADQAPAEVIDATIRAGVPFAGTNLWLLVLAILIASVGLNVNSTAVIIGAMLISPLMGPIMGLGYGTAIADFALVRRALINLTVAAVASVAASALYFAVSPLAAAQSELLARTTPTLWDVLIAAFGGLAGMVGLTRKERSNVLPGVAIATALMPPLCTAGFGIARGEPAYVAGAFYLFMINSVFIAAATFVVSGLLRLPELAHSDEAARRRAHRWLLVLVLATTLPSFLLARQLVAEELFASRARSFAAEAIPGDWQSFVVDSEVDAGARTVTLTLVGTPLPPDRLRLLEALMPQYGLNEAALQVRQSDTPQIDVAALRREVSVELVPQLLTEVKVRDQTIEALRRQLDTEAARSALLTQLQAELTAQLPTASEVRLLPDPRSRGWVVLLTLEAPLEPPELARLQGWLLVRTGGQSVEIVQISAPPKP